MLNKNGKLTPLSQISPPDYRSAIALFHQTPSLSDDTVLDNLTAPLDFKYRQNKKFDKNWHLQKLTTLDKHDNFINQSMSCQGTNVKS